MRDRGQLEVSIKKSFKTEGEEGKRRKNEGMIAGLDQFKEVHGCKKTGDVKKDGWVEGKKG